MSVRWLLCPYDITVRNGRETRVARVDGKPGVISTSSEALTPNLALVSCRASDWAFLSDPEIIDLVGSAHDDELRWAWLETPIGDLLNNGQINGLKNALSNVAPAIVLNDLTNADPMGTYLDRLMAAFGRPIGRLAGNFG